MATATSPVVLSPREQHNKDGTPSHDCEDYGPAAGLNLEIDNYITVCTMCFAVTKIP